MSLSQDEPSRSPTRDAAPTRFLRGKTRKKKGNAFRIHRSHPMRISFAEIAARRVRLTPAEVVALALTAARQLRRDTATAVLSLPSAGDILLSSAGEVVIRDSDAAADQSDQAQMRWLAGLVHELLTLDSDSLGDRRTPIPGGLLVLLARASGQIDLPQPTYAALLDGLARFGSDDSRALAALYWRCAGRAADACEERPLSTV